jgi:hypothetical protein
MSRWLRHFRQAGYKPGYEKEIEENVRKALNIAQ